MSCQLDCKTKFHGWVSMACSRPQGYAFRQSDRCLNWLASSLAQVAVTGDSFLLLHCIPQPYLSWIAREVLTLILFPRSYWKSCEGTLLSAEAALLKSRDHINRFDLFDNTVNPSKVSPSFPVCHASPTN